MAGRVKASKISLLQGLRVARLDGPPANSVEMRDIPSRQTSIVVTGNSFRDNFLCPMGERRCHMDTLARLLWNR